MRSSIAVPPNQALRASARLSAGVGRIEGVVVGSLARAVWILIHGGTQFLGTRMTRFVDPPDLCSTR